jgi:hypothetical protein
MRLPANSLRCEPKEVVTIKQNQCEQFDWFSILLFYCYVDGQIPPIIIFSLATRHTQPPIS